MGAIILGVLLLGCFVSYGEQGELRFLDAMNTLAEKSSLVLIKDQVRAGCYVLTYVLFRISTQFR